MTGSAVSEGRLDAITAFVPVVRPRVVRRIAQAARHRIALVVASAGYGKSIAVRQYLESQERPYVRYDVQSEHATLLGFVRGFSDALDAVAPHARQSVSGAYDKSAQSATPGIDLARWLYVHLHDFSGTFVIDDLQVAQGDPEVMAFLLALAEHTRSQARWILVSRALPDLPIGSWQAYGDLGLVIEEADLRFTDVEARATAEAASAKLADDELAKFLILTEGWPTALSFALHTATGAGDLQNAAALTREMMYRYLAEQVYRSLDTQQREFLHFTAYLAEIDLDVAHHAGFTKARALLESLRDRVAFISPGPTGIYHCHELFRDFLQYELDLQGEDVVEAMKVRAARALDAAGRTAPALSLFAQLRLEPDLVRILVADGFDLMERAHGDAVKVALDALPKEVQTKQPVALGLRALIESDAGHLDRARALFQRAIANATSRELAAELATRLAIVLYNKGDDGVPEVLAPFSTATDISPGLQAECASLSAAALALRGSRDEARPMITLAEGRMHDIDSAASRAKVLLRLSVACYHCGEVDRAKEWAAQAAALSSDSNLFSLAARAYSQLAFIAMAEDDDSEQLRRYADLAASSAEKAGDIIALQTAMLHSLNAETRLGNLAEVQRLLRKIESTGMKDPYRASGLRWPRALCAAWEGNFAEAHAQLSPVCGTIVRPAERLLNTVLCALLLAADGKIDEVKTMRSKIANYFREIDKAGTYEKRQAEVSRLLCILVDTIIGKEDSSSKIMRQECFYKSTPLDVFKDAVRELQSRLIASGSNAKCGTFQELRDVGYGGYSLLLESLSRLSPVNVSARNPMTTAEVAVLCALSAGQTPKQIAFNTARSVFTVRTHIKNAAFKLGCSGQTESIAVARERGWLK